MAHTAETEDGHASETEAAVGLRVHSTLPHRTVFTEPKNSDGWISTDLTVEVRR